MSNRTYDILRQVVSEYSGTPDSSGTGRGAYLAGLAINEAIDSLNRRPFWWQVSLANLTLVSGSKTYTLSSTWPSFKTHLASILLNAAGTQKERDVLYLTPTDFFRAGYETGTYTGAPSYLTVDILNGLIRLDRDPTATYNGRVIRTLYYREIGRLSTGSGTLGVPDQAEDLVVQDAIWRIKRLARLPASEWKQDQENAKDAKREALATPQSVDLASLGFLGG